MHSATLTYVNATAPAEGSAAVVRDHAQCENSNLSGYAYVQLSKEKFSRLGTTAMALLNNLAECASASGVVFKDNSVVKAPSELSVGLSRRNCMLNKRTLYALGHVSGTAFRSGDDILTSDIF